MRRTVSFEDAVLLNFLVWEGVAFFGVIVIAAIAK